MWLHADIQSLPDIVRHYARVTPDKTALIEGRHRMSFRELDHSSNRLAQGLARQGAKPESVVAYIGKNSIPFFEILFGCGKAGCILLPLNWRLAAAELVPIIDDAQPVLVFVDKDYLPLMEAVQKSVAQPSE